MLHARDHSKAGIDGKAPILIRPKRLTNISPRQAFWREKRKAGWPEWLIVERWQAQEKARLEAQAAKLKRVKPARTGKRKRG